MNTEREDVNDLVGKILVATPTIPVKYMNKSMVYICRHDYNGTVGVIVNKIIPGMEAHRILEKLNVNLKDIDNMRINFGGPEEIDQCFMLHSDDFMSPNSVVINKNIALTINGDLIKALTLNVGPKQKILCMGCCLWEQYQLEDEIAANYWIPIDQDDALIFGDSKMDKWGKAILKIGSRSQVFSISSGNA